MVRNDQKESGENDKQKTTQEKEVIRSGTDGISYSVKILTFLVEIR